jgi:hypothetical protein
MNGANLGRFPIRFDFSFLIVFRVNFKNLKPPQHMGKQALMKQRGSDRYEKPKYQPKPSSYPPQKSQSRYDSEVCFIFFETLKYSPQQNKNFDQREHDYRIDSGYSVSGSGGNTLKRGYEDERRFYEPHESKKPKYEDEYVIAPPIPPPKEQFIVPVDDSFKLRKTIIEEEKKLLDQYYYINSLRKMLSFQSIKDYDFQEIIDSKIRIVKLSELFITSPFLIVFHLDNPNCSYCTTLIDTLQVYLN